MSAQTPAISLIKVINVWRLLHTMGRRESDKISPIMPLVSVPMRFLFFY